MTAATIPGLDSAPTKHEGLLAWVREIAELTQPERVAFAEGLAHVQATVYGSHSWRLTAPLRAFTAFLRRLRG